MNKILNLFELGLINKASSRTMRYFISRGEAKNESFDKECKDVIFTFLTIRSKGRNNAKITINEEDYLVNEYEFTENMNSLIASAKVYATDGAVGVSEVWNLPCAPSNEDDDDFKDAKLVSPERVRSFFTRYNEAQKDDGVVKTMPVKFEDTSLSDFGALVSIDDDTKWIQITKDGKYNENVALLNGVKSPFATKYVIVRPQSNDEVMAEWLTL